MNDLSSFQSKGFVLQPDGFTWAKPRRANSARLHPGDQKRAERKSLERTVSREETRHTRLTIRFTVYARRPADWDGWHIKELQDCLIAAGIISGDAWDILQGEVRSEKAHSKEEERTEIIIEGIQ